MLSAQGLSTGRDLYRATTVVTRGFDSSGRIRRIVQFSRLIRHTRGCGGPILTRIVSGPHSVASYDIQGNTKDLFLNGFLRVTWSRSERSINQLHLYRDLSQSFEMDALFFWTKSPRSLLGNCDNFISPKSMKLWQLTNSQPFQNSNMLTRKTHSYVTKSLH
jgi:hypothetical protein